MDKDELTREEIEALLGGKTPPGPPPHPTPRPAQSANGAVGAAMGPACQRAAERLTAGLADMLRWPTTVRFAGMRSTTYGQFLTARGRASFCCVLRCRSPEGGLLLDVTGPVLQAMIARLLGGDPQESGPARRMLTEIERRLASRILAVLATELAAAWPSADLRLDEPGDQPDPADALSLSADHPVAVARFDVSLGDVHGPVDLCLPAELVAPLAERLSSGTSPGKPSPLSAGLVPSASPETAAQIARALENSLVELRVELARTTATAGDLLHLAVGDIITTDQPADAPLVIDLDGRPAFEARPGIHDGRKAVRIERRLS